MNRWPDVEPLFIRSLPQEEAISSSQEEEVRRSTKTKVPEKLKTTDSIPTLEKNEKSLTGNDNITDQDVLPTEEKSVMETVESGKEIEDSPPEQTLSKVLKENGLNPKHWVKVFMGQGILSKEQFQHIDRLTLNKLLGKSQYTWERSALNKLIADSKKEEFVKQEEKFEKLRSKLPDTHKILSDAFQQNVDRRKEVFDDKAWLKQFDLDKVNDKLKKEVSGQELVHRIPHKSSDLIRKIAAGQLLRGQFMYKNLQESSTYRHTLIDVDNCIELMLPDSSETMETYEFNEKEQSDRFESVLNQSGKSLAGAVCYGGLGFGVQAHGSAEYTNINQTNTTTNTQKLTVIIHQLLNVPMASITLSNAKVSLSECALKALKILNGMVNETKDDFEKECELFFHEFGSHYYTGLCHFGGRYKWTVFSESSSITVLKENYDIAKLALSGSVSGGCSWFGGEIKCSSESGQENQVKNRAILEKCKVTKKLEKFGGPQEVDDIPLWKRGLAEYNDTWVIIDKEVSHKCYEGVWKLIQNQPKDFKEPGLFSKKVFEEWKKHFQKGEMSWIKDQL